MTLRTSRRARHGPRGAIAAAVAVLTSLAALGCARVPITGRKELVMISAPQELELGEAVYREVRAESLISKDAAANEQARRVGERLARAAEEVAPQTTRGFRWEVTVFDAPDKVNAFCLPGGKIGVYTGLLPIAENDAGLAVVLGHEVAHAIARHGAERMSRGIVERLGMEALNVAVANKNPDAVRAVDAAYAIGLGLGEQLPFSRSQESEADRIGLVLMAKAGYDPRAALSFWKRMMALDGAHAPAFLSDHPSDAQRLKDLEAEMPEALRSYRP